MIRYLFLFASAGLAVTPLQAGDPPAQQETPPPAASAKETPDAKAPERRICRVRTVTGSRLQTEKVCRTPSEWAADEKDMRDSLDTRRGTQNN